MPDLKMSSFIAQNAQTLTNLGSVASKFSGEPVRIQVAWPAAGIG